MKYAMELHKPLDSIIISYTHVIVNAQENSHQEKEECGGFWDQRGCWFSQQSLTSELDSNCFFINTVLSEY